MKNRPQIIDDNSFDALTGFQMNIELRREFKRNPDAFLYPAVVVVFNVSGLQKINREQGRLEGDRQIADLGKKMVKYLPKASLFYRGYESEAFAIIKDKDEKSITDAAQKIVNDCIGRIYYGIDTLTPELIRRGQNLSNAIDNAYYYLEIRQMLNNESNHSQFLSTFITALKLVDSDTEEHVKRTQGLGLALGKNIGLNSSVLGALELLCLLHDIGKITVPLDILNKPGKLTEEEWVVIRSHTTKGYDMIANIDGLKPIANSVLSHHERWDGKGYPNGLKGEEIPILARIISVVDAFDTMINDRSYRKALSVEAAIQELKDNAGTQFDPYLVERFLMVLKEHPELAISTTTNKEIKVYKKSDPKEIGTGITEQVEYGEYILDVNYLIIGVGQNFTKMTGYTEEEAVNKMSQFDLIPEEEIPHYRAVAAKCYVDSDRAYLTHPIVRKDGKLVDVVCLGERYFDSATKQYKSRIMIFKAR